MYFVESEYIFLGFVPKLKAEILRRKRNFIEERARCGKIVANIFETD